MLESHPPRTRSSARGAAGLTTRGSVSRRRKIRSEEAMAACRMLNFSERSEIGRQKRSEYWMKATSTPRVTVPRRTSPPPQTRMRPTARAARSSIAG